MKAKSNKPDAYEALTARIIEKLESGVIPWRKPWKGGQGGAPRNLISKKPYRGFNVLWLHCQPFASAYWLTFKQAKDLGGSVRKGEKGTPIIFWKFLEVDDKDKAGSKKRIPMARRYTVFNLEQCDIPADKLPESEQVELTEHEAIAEAAAIVDAMPNRPTITHNEPRAYYRPSTDSVNMPQLGLFDGAEEYYSTLFHELGHAVDLHDSRLGTSREAKTAIAAFGDAEYSKGELVAECCAAFLCGASGISAPVIDNQAAYIQGWLKALKNDKRLLISAAARAQKCADYIQGVEAVVEG